MELPELNVDPAILGMYTTINMRYIIYTFLSVYKATFVLAVPHIKLIVNRCEQRPVVTKYIYVVTNPVNEVIFAQNIHILQRVVNMVAENCHSIFQ